MQQAIHPRAEFLLHDQNMAFFIVHCLDPALTGAGEFKDGLMHGRGVLKNKLGVYDGEFSENKMHGKGRSAFTIDRRMTCYLYSPPLYALQLLSSRIFKFYDNPVIESQEIQKDGWIFEVLPARTQSACSNADRPNKLRLVARSFTVLYLWQKSLTL